MAGTFRVNFGADYDGAGDADIVSSNGTPFGDLALGNIAAGVVGGEPGRINLVTASGTVTGFTTDAFGTLTPLFASSGGFLLDYTGGTGTAFLVGGEFRDSLVGGGFNDTLDGGRGDNTLVGGDGNDVLASDGNGFGTLIGGAGRDTVTYANAAFGVNAAIGATSGDTIDASVEILIGSAFGDNLTGSAGNDTIFGGAGGDNVNGGAGNDVLNGGADGGNVFGDAGDDLLIAGRDGGNLVGGEGNDTASFIASTTGVTASVFGFGGGSSLMGIENLIGSSFGDALTGDEGANRLVGEGGADTILGGGGADRLRGDGGDDALDGGAGRDVLDGGTEADRLLGGLDADLLTGGAGADTFLWLSAAESAGAARDRVADFDESGGDLLDLSAFGATYAGNGRFTGGAEASVIWRARRDGAATTVLLDGNGDGAADLVFTLTGVAALTRDDFVL